MKKDDHLTLPWKRLLPFIFVSLLSACAQTTPKLDQQFGESVRQSRERQTLNPLAGGDAPVNGIDAAAARESIGRYRSSYRETPPPATPLTTGIAR